MSKDAKPDRFVVDRKGTPDPADSEYYVLDLVHDVFAREVAWMLVRKYRSANQVISQGGRSIKADELEQLLRDTDAACSRNIEAHQVAAKGKVGRPKSARPQR